MPRPASAKTKPDSAAALGFEAKLWLAADKLRNNMDAAEYKHVVLGLIFLKYISDSFEEHHAKLVAGKGAYQGANPEDPDEYRAEAIFWVPPAARWTYLQNSAKQPTIGKIVDDAMVAIERDNPRLKGVLPKDYARPALDQHRLGELIDLIGTIGLGDRENRSKDILGHVYEYFLSQFASAEGKKGGQFYTPTCVVRLLVEMLAPYQGRVYDAACGSGGMFVQSEKFVESHGGKLGDISIYGQESNATTRRLAVMNLALRGIEADFGPEQADTFRRDLHPDLRADYVLANPPFNDSDWFRRDDDVRWRFGVPPKGNANFAWVQHFIHHLAPQGMAGFILGNISLTSETGGEDVIRKGIIEANLLECIVTLPDKLFFSTPIPVGIWVINKGRTNSKSKSSRHGDILFIDAGKLGNEVTRTHRELTEDNIFKVAKTYRQWASGAAGYQDTEGFCRSVSISEVASNAYNLLPAAYVNAGRKDGRSHIHLGDVLRGETADQVASQLKSLATLGRSFDETIGRVREAVAELESSVRFEKRTLGDLLEESNDRLGDEPEPEVLTCTESGGLILQRERFAKRVATDDAGDYKIVRRGDIVYNPYLLWKGSIDQCWIVDVGITSPAYEVFRVRQGWDPTIVGQLVTSPEMVKRYDGISFGTVQRRRRAPSEKFLELEVNVPAHEHIQLISKLLRQAQDCQFASRSSERSIKDLLKSICQRLR
ncbi:MAG: N-6 DNA methylase [Verrucomicrobia bacterium]|nr:N-6 DNA methylase [Verrucomicrobiota bacterium]